MFRLIIYLFHKDGHCLCQNTFWSKKVTSGCRLTASVSCSIIFHLSLHFIPLFYQQFSSSVPECCGGAEFDLNAKSATWNTEDIWNDGRKMWGKGDRTESGGPSPFSYDSRVLHLLSVQMFTTLTRKRSKACVCVCVCLFVGGWRCSAPTEGSRSASECKS